MKEQKNIGLVIGRFQLVGNQHVDLFRQIEEYHKNVGELDELYVGIGVTDVVDGNNPFSSLECKQMIKLIAEDVAKNMKIPLKLEFIEDIHNPPKYAQHVADKFKINLTASHVTLFSSNKDTNKCFEGKKNYKVVEIQERIGKHSTELRKKYACGADISDLVPEQVIKYLEERNIKKRIEKLLYDNPVPTVDLVLEYEGELVIIERGVEPLGYALPGGHIDYGESAERAAIREGKEELGLELIILKGLIGVFSDPGRDSRGHKITIAYAAEGFGELNAGSDARAVKTYPLDEIPDLLFDHNEIIAKYKKMKAEVNFDNER